MSLYDIIDNCLSKGMSVFQIVKHIKSLEKYNDLSEDTIRVTIDVIKRDRK